MNKRTGAHFNVAQLLKEPIGATRRYNIVVDLQQPASDVKKLEPLAGQMRLLRTDRGILVEGELSGLVTTQCGRCLADANVPVTLPIEEEFQPTLDILQGTRAKIDEEDAALLIDEHHILDLSEVLRQNLLLTIPLRPLCRPDCAGLCPNCGHDLNSGPCDCQPVEVDPRWEKLSALLALQT